ncbi:MAG: glucose-1-phosphate adenylyltransferase [Chitinispirillales bacterium]|jgi:glucose-1-phosphate adenylyltransferase|nr:glucose-1-phosphate adenylyltransferase [Chitinispirillales bacterium]
MNDPSVTSIILAGGQGSRLAPLTDKRSKPAVPIGGKFRLIDIPISNCLNHGIRHIWVLTQFASESLHRHIFQTYRLDYFSKGFVSILAASQTPDNKDGKSGTEGWYKGTADAVRKNLSNFSSAGENVLLLSGDHLYRMDFEDLIKFHCKNDADVTLSVIPIPRSQVSELGILKMDSNCKVMAFKEKSKDEKLIDDFAIPPELREKAKGRSEEKTHVGSMGIYLFKKKVLVEILEKFEHHDFGKEIIPAAIESCNVYAYKFDGYWEDIGTIKAFFDAHMLLTSDNPPFNFYDENKPIFTRARFLPAAKFSGANVTSSIVCEGSIIGTAAISESIIGVRSIIGDGSRLSRVIMMGADYYSNESDGHHASVGIGRNCRIKNAIVDKDVYIGDDVRLENHQDLQNASLEHGIAIKDGIIIVPKGTTVPSGYAL